MGNLEGLFANLLLENEVAHAEEDDAEDDEGKIDEHNIGLAEKRVILPTGLAKVDE